MIIEYLFSAFSDGFGGVIIGVFSWFVVLCMLFLLLLIINVIGVTKTQCGVVIEKHFIPEYTTTSTVLVGKMLMPLTHYYANEWQISIKIDDEIGKITITESVFNNIKKGQCVNCEYTKGLIFGDLNIQKIL